MARMFRVLREQKTPESQARAQARAAEVLAELPLHELRQARRLSQEALAEKLGARQASISKLERRTDMHVSTLRSYIEAMGGSLEIVARFPDGEVRVGQFGAISSYQYPIGGARREPPRMHEPPVEAATPRRARSAGAIGARRRADSLDDLRALRGPITEIASRHGAMNLRVFGSAVRDEMRADSDVDLLVRTGKRVGPWFPGGLAAELSELLGRRVDVVTEQGLTAELREQVLREAAPL